MGLGVGILRGAGGVEESLLDDQGEVDRVDDACAGAGDYECIGAAGGDGDGCAGGGVGGDGAAS